MSYNDPGNNFNHLVITSLQIVTLVAIFLGLSTQVHAEDLLPLSNLKVIRVLDGDTVEVLSENTKHRVRFADVDAPEKYQQSGKDATAYLTHLLDIAGGLVFVEVHSTDRYGRWVATLYTHTPVPTNLNLSMVRAGYAWWYQKYSDKSEYGIAEYEARKAKLGLWYSDSAVAPWDWRRGAREGKPTIYHANPGTKTFHAPGCRHYGDRLEMVVISDRKLAIFAGYKPCKLCNP